MPLSDAPARLAFFTGPNAARQASDFFGRLFYHGGNDIPYYLQAAQQARLFDTIVSDAGGMTSVSARGKEQLVYEHDPVPYTASRTYLEDRDVPAWAATTQFAEKMWMTHPRLTERHQPFLDLLERTMFLSSMRDAEAYARRDGIAYLYVRATGDPGSPLQPGDRTVAFSPVGAWQISESNVERHRGDDPLLLQHGIEKVSIRTRDVEGRGQTVDVHGHRLIKLVRNRGRGYLWPAYDDLWYMKDLLFSLRMAQYAGNPIAVKVDIKWLQAIAEGGVAEDLSEPEMQKLKEQFTEQTAKIQSGAVHSYAPLKGLEVYRVGKSDLDDPLPILRAVASRISMATGLSTNRILASSRGSEQVTDEDRIDEMTSVYERQLMDVRPVYAHLLELMRHTKQVPARIPTLPPELTWPYTRILNPRETAYVHGKNASTLSTALNAGHWPSQEVLRDFTRVTEVFDPRFQLPKLAPVVPDLPGVVHEIVEDEDEPPMGASAQERADDLAVRRRTTFKLLSPDDDE